MLRPRMAMVVSATMMPGEGEDHVHEAHDGHVQPPVVGSEHPQDHAEDRPEPMEETEMYSDIRAPKMTRLRMSRP